MKNYTFLLLFGLLLFPVVTYSQVTEIEQGDTVQQPACPPYSEEAHDLLKRFVASSLPHTAQGVTVEAVSPSEIVWVERHIRCEHMVHNPESEMFLTFWKSNQYYFILAMHRNPVRVEDGNIVEIKLGTDRVNILDLNLNRIRVFSL
ncbi:MAG: hypothetical protein JJU41_00010 [Bacteroidetes bacterium]|nr:hypothetical protein [Bacteroidota bacterium]